VNRPWVRHLDDSERQPGHDGEGSSEHAEVPHRRCRVNQVRMARAAHTPVVLAGQGEPCHNPGDEQEPSASRNGDHQRADLQHDWKNVSPQGRSGEQSRLGGHDRRRQGGCQGKGAGQATQSQEHHPQEQRRECDPTSLPEVRYSLVSRAAPH
jgi:hypothetical protein